MAKSLAGVAQPDPDIEATHPAIHLTILGSIGYAAAPSTFPSPFHPAYYISANLLRPFIRKVLDWTK